LSKIVMIEIDAEANVSVETAGYKGQGCTAVQKVFGDALGTTTSASKKPEYFTKVVNKQKLVQ